MIRACKGTQRSLCCAAMFAMCALMLPGRITGSALAEGPAVGDAAAAETEKGSEGVEELLLKIEQLEVRVKELEAERDKSASAPPPALSSSSPQGGTPAADGSKAKQDSKPDNGGNGILGFFHSAELSGFVDGYYGYNFNQPDGEAPLRNFDTRHNQFSLNLAEIALEKKPAASERVGFRLDLDFGPATETVHLAEPGGLDVFRHFQQGYLSYLAPMGKGLQVDVGKFVTQHGAEVIETKDNWNYSRSLLFALAIPYYHMGARAAYSFSDRFALAGYLVNGWNNAVDNNDAKTFGLQVVFKPGVKWSIVQNYMAGPEQPENNDDWRQLWDTSVAYTVTPQLTLMGNYDYGMDRSSGARVHWQGFAAYARYQAHKVWALSPRFEWLDDPDGFATGIRQSLKDFTLTSEQKISGSLLTRFEYRRDFSDQEFFPKAGGPAVKAQSTLTFGILYAFSSGGE